MTFEGRTLEETPILDGRLLCVQPRPGYRFSVDALLLAHFVLVRAGRPGSLVELGAGCGIVSLLLARGGFEAGTAIEIEPVLHHCCRETMRRNGLASSFRSIRGDLRTIREHVAPGNHAVMVSNPPFFPVASGRVSPDPVEAGARFETRCTMRDVLSAARYALAPGGRLFLIYPVARLPELMAELPGFKLRATALRMVHPRSDEPAVHFLLESTKSRGPALAVLPPLVTHGEEDSYGIWYPELKHLTLDPTPVSPAPTP